MYRPRLFNLLLLSLALSALTLPSQAAPPLKTMHLASLDWQPYVGPALTDGGVSATIAATAVRQFGYQLKIDYFPWNRAMQMGSKDAEFDGYFPAYYTEERARQCHFSAAMGSSTLGLAYLKDGPVEWKSLPDLIGLRIGVVAGYSNGAAFDAMVKAGKLTVDASQSDSANLKKLLAGRVRAVAIDKSVMRYLVLTDAELIAKRDQIGFHERPLAELTLHVCFKRTPVGSEQQRAFDYALRSMDIHRIENEYFQRLERSLPAAEK